MANFLKLNSLMHLTDPNESKPVAPRDGFGEGLIALGRTREDVVVLCGDLTESTRVQGFKDAFPTRFIEVGVAEQNMAGIAAGLALENKLPFVASYAVFSPGRNWDQIRVSICYADLAVKFAGAHAGISVGPDGATHQALEDIAITRVLPNMTVVAPADFAQCKIATLAIVDTPGPAYIRFGRERAPSITTEQTPFKLGRADVYRTGKDVTIVACGQMVAEALRAARALMADGIDAQVINCHTIKPLDVKTISSAARATGAVVTAEEHQIHGGLGGAVAEALGQHYPVPMEMVAVPDHFGQSGKPQELLDMFGLNPDGIAEAVRRVMKRKK